MKNRGSISEQIKKLERSIRKFGDHPKEGQDIGPKQKAINELRELENENSN